MWSWVAPIDRRSFRDGIRVMTPLSLAIAVWGVVTGVAMVNSGMPVWAGVLMTVTVYAGSAQLSALPLLALGTPLPIVWATALVVNLRFVIFAASRERRPGVRAVLAALRGRGGVAALDAMAAANPAVSVALGSRSASLSAQEGTECLGVCVADPHGDLGGVEVGGCREMPSPFDAKTLDEAERSEVECRADSSFEGAPAGAERLRDGRDVERFVEAGAHEAFELDDDRVIVAEVFVGDEGRLRRALVDDEQFGDVLGQVGADRSHE